MKDDEIEIAVQVNGKTRAVINVPADIAKDDVIAQGRRSGKGQAGRKYRKRDLRSWKNCKYCLQII